MKKVKIGMGRMRVRFSEELNEFCIEMAWCFVVNQQDLRVVIGCFVKACKKKGSGKESR